MSTLNVIVNFLFSAAPKIVGVSVSIGAAFLISRAIYISLSRSMLARKWLPSYFQIKTFFSGSVFWLIFCLTARGALPYMDLRGIAFQTIDKILESLVIIFLAWTLTRLVHLLKLAFYTTMNINHSNNLGERKLRTQVQFIEKIVLIFIYTLAIALLLMNFEEAKKIGRSIIASAGLAGVVLGIAAQRSLANLLAGFQIAFTQPIRIEDEVIVEGEWGRVEEITLTHVVIRIWDKRTLIVPITYFLEKPFQNWTHASPELLGVVFLILDYSTPVDLLRMEFQKFLETNPLWDHKTAVLQVTDSTDKAIQIRFIMSARNASEAFDLRCSVREHFITYVQNNFPQIFPQNRVNALNPSVNSEKKAPPPNLTVLRREVRS